MIRFQLNGSWVEESDFDPNMTVLQYLRQVQHLKGSKEGCASGDCSACTILVGHQKHGQIQYAPINSCITLLAQLNNQYVVTIEGLETNQTLHPAQKAMVEHHGSQCGFCTPGIVCSLAALHFNQVKNQKTSATTEDIEHALAGNLCRCTGYSPIVKAANAMFEYPLENERSVLDSCSVEVFEPKCTQANSTEIKQDANSFFIPNDEQTLKTFLAKYPNATIWAGGTDLALEVTQRLKNFECVISLQSINSLKKINTDENNITIGAMCTYEDVHSLFNQFYPALGQLLFKIGSLQIRHMGTLAGNLANGSPIGDMAPVLIALDASINISSLKENKTIKVEDFFQGYKSVRLNSGEYIESISIPKLTDQQKLFVYKVSKRQHDDISSLLMACVLKIKDETIVSVSMAYGGMADIPKRAKNVELSLNDSPLVIRSFECASEKIDTDFNPISDVRSSAEYRKQVAKNLIIKMGIACMEEIA